jgi:hypothetical protein
MSICAILTDLNLKGFLPKETEMGPSPDEPWSAWTSGNKVSPSIFLLILCGFSFNSRDGSQ